MLALSAALIAAAIVLQVMYGHLVDGGGISCTANPFTSVATSCLYPDGYVFSKAIQTFAPGAFIAGVVGLLLLLLLRGVSHALGTVAVTKMFDSAVKQHVDPEVYRRPSE